MHALSDEVISSKTVGVLRGIIGARLSNKISPSSHLVDDLGFDSVMAIRVMLEFERVFKINVAEKSDSINIAEIVTVGDLIGLVRRLL